MDMLMLIYQQRSSKRQFYSLWFNLAGAQTHDQPHFKEAC
jgi:hypothetical protein